MAESGENAYKEGDSVSFVSNYRIFHELSPDSVIDILINIPGMSHFREVGIFPSWRDEKTRRRRMTITANIYLAFYWNSFLTGSQVLTFYMLTDLLLVVTGKIVILIIYIS